LNLPALAEPDDLLGRSIGEPLWPERFGLDDLNRIKATLGSYWFSALYQGSPQPAEGGAFKRSWFRSWTPEGELFNLDGHYVAKKHCRRFGTVDLAYTEKRGSDYTVIAAWAVTPDHRLILLDLHRERMEGPKLVPAVKKMVAKHNLDYVGIEEVAAQALIVQQARQEGLTVRALRADRDKVSRAIPATVRCEAGQVFFPESAPWLDEFTAELLAFPHGAHDDQVDALAYAAVEVQRFGGAAEPHSYQDTRAYAEKELAAEFFNRAANPLFWVGDDDD
jgi:predicted phage terminase large subunit-like protein